MDIRILIAETLGTMLLILLGDGVVANVLLGKTKGNGSGWIVITWAWAMAVFVGAYSAVALGSGAHLNPAVTVGLMVAGNANAIAFAPSYFIGEFVGAALGAFFVWLHFYPHWAATSDPGLKLAVFSTGPAIRNTAMNLISEIIGTFVLMFAILAIPANFLPGPFTVGLAVLVIGLALGGTTGYAINPARDLSPRIMHAILPIPGKGSSDWGYSWIPVVGPIIGAIIAALLWLAVKPLV